MHFGLESKKRFIALVIALSLGSVPAQVGGMSSLRAPKTEAEQLFGYNPHYSEIPQAKPGDKKIALLLLHGFGCPRGENYKNYFPGDDRYMPVTFDFKDTLWLNKKSLAACTLSPLETIQGLRSVNIGQTPDAEVALYGLIQLWKAGHKSVIFGHSRGGAAAIRIADMLAHPDAYLVSWKKLGMTNDIIIPGFLWNGKKTVVDTKKIESLKQSIVKIYLEKPMLDINSILGKSFQSSLDFGADFNKATKQPIQLLEGLVDQKLPMHFTLAQCDEVVTNNSDQKLKELVAKAGWTVVNVEESHSDVRETKNIFASYLTSLNQPAPVVAARLARQRCCRRCH